MSDSTAVTVAEKSGLDVSTGRIGAVALGQDLFAGADLNQRFEIIKGIAQSGMIPYKDPFQAFAVHLKGHELGLAPMASFENIFAFSQRGGGTKLGMSAASMSAVGRARDGFDYKILEKTAKKCTIEAWSDAFPEHEEFEWDLNDVEAAGLSNKDNHRKFPKQMKFWRALGDAARAKCPSLAGMHSLEEMVDEGFTVNEHVDLPVSDGPAGLNAAVAAVQEAEVVEAEPAARKGSPDDGEAEVAAVAAATESSRPQSVESEDSDRTEAEVGPSGQARASFIPDYLGTIDEIRALLDQKGCDFDEALAVENAIKAEDWATARVLVEAVRSKPDVADEGQGELL